METFYCAENHESVKFSVSYHSKESYFDDGRYFDVSYTCYGLPVTDMVFAVNHRAALDKVVCPHCLLKGENQKSFLYSNSHNKPLGYGCPSVNFLFDQDLNVLAHFVIGMRHTYRSEIYRSQGKGADADISYMDGYHRPCNITREKVLKELARLEDEARSEVAKSSEFLKFIGEVIVEKENEAKRLRQKFRVVA